MKIEFVLPKRREPAPVRRAAAKVSALRNAGRKPEDRVCLDARRSHNIAGLRPRYLRTIRLFSWHRRYRGGPKERSLRIDRMEMRKLLCAGNQKSPDCIECPPNGDLIMNWAHCPIQNGPLTRKGASPQSRSRAPTGVSAGYNAGAPRLPSGRVLGMREKRLASILGSKTGYSEIRTLHCTN
jgi:hypothetical protein